MSKKFDIITNTSPSPVEINTPVKIDPEIYYKNADNALNYFTIENAPDDPKKLKQEIKFLASLTGKAWIILAHRAKKYKDQELYKIDGYSDFKSWVEGELDLARTMIYNYIWVIEEFGVQPVEQVKLSNLITLLKPVKEYPQDKEQLIEKAKKLSKRELIKYIKDNYYSEKEDLEESEEESIHFYSSEEELINNSKFIRAGMKAKTVKAILKDMTNWLLLHKPKNKELKKIMESLKKL